MKPYDRPSDDELAEMYEEMTVAEMQEHLGLGSGSTVSKWLADAGVETRPAHRRGYSDEELLRLLDEAMREHGDDVSMPQFSARGGPVANTVAIRFGGWEAAKEEARR